MKTIQEFFWFCAGADIETLRTCPTDHAKYMGIGGTILFTAIMAGLAGGYAFHSAFDQANLSIAFGVFWGMMIFNLDRYIVSSTGTGDGTSKITRSEWKNAFPRLMMALLLGFVIATPLELRLFEKEISMEIETLKQQKRAEARNEIEVNYGEIQALELKVLALETVVKEKGAVRDASYQAMIQEAEGLAGSGKPGAGKIYRDKKLQYDKQERSYQELAAAQGKKISAMEIRIQDLQQSRDEEVQNIDNIAGQYDGLMAKLEAFNNLTAEHPTLNISKWLITAMFIFIETAPILFKMMTERGPYDDKVARIKHVTAVTEVETMSKATETSGTNIRLSAQKNKNRFIAEIQANEKLLIQLAQAKAEIAELALQKWKVAEIQKADLDYEAYLTQQ